MQLNGTKLRIDNDSTTSISSSFYKNNSSNLEQSDKVKATRRLFVFGLNIVSFVERFQKSTSTTLKPKIDLIEHCAQIDFSSPMPIKLIKSFINSSCDFQQLESFVSKKTKGIHFIVTESAQSSSLSSSSSQSQSSFSQQPSSSYLAYGDEEDDEEEEGQYHHLNAGFQCQQSSQIKNKSKNKKSCSSINCIQQCQQYDQQQHKIFQDLIKLLIKNPSWNIKDLFKFIKRKFKNDTDQMARIIGVIGHKTTALENIVRINQQETCSQNKNNIIPQYIQQSQEEEVYLQEDGKENYQNNSTSKQQQAQERQAFTSDQRKQITKNLSKQHHHHHQIKSIAKCDNQELQQQDCILIEDEVDLFDRTNKKEDSHNNLEQQWQQILEKQPISNNY